MAFGWVEVVLVGLTDLLVGLGLVGLCLVLTVSVRFGCLVCVGLLVLVLNRLWLVL